MSKSSEHESGRRRNRALATGVAAALALSAAGIASAHGGASLLEPEVGSVKVPRHGHVAATARCHDGSEVVSGGFATPDVAYAGGGPYTDTVGAARDGKRRFVSRASNDAFRVGRFYSYAYCGDFGQDRDRERQHDDRQLQERQREGALPGRDDRGLGRLPRFGAERRPRRDGAVPVEAHRHPRLEDRR